MLDNSNSTLSFGNDMAPLTNSSSSNDMLVPASNMSSASPLDNSFSNFGNKTYTNNSILAMNGRLRLK